MKMFLRSERWNRNAHSSEVLRMLGLQPGEKLPAAGLPPRELQGITVWVAPLRERDERRGVREHRVRARCPHCQREMSAGRLHQHRCTQPCTHARRVMNYALGYEQCADCSTLLPASHAPHNPRTDFSD